MATRPLPEADEFRFAPYIEDLREFFTTSHLPAGSPEDVPEITNRLALPGPFADDLSSLLRSIVLREGGAMPHAQLLDILAFAIGGPEMKQSPHNYQQPLRQLLSFVAAAMSRPWNMPPQAPATIVPFPSEAAGDNHVPSAALEDPAIYPAEAESVPTPASPTSAEPQLHGSAIGAALAERQIDRPTPDSHADSPTDPQKQAPPDLAEPSPAAAAKPQPHASRPFGRSLFPWLAMACAAVLITGALIWHANQATDIYRVQPVPVVAKSPAPHTTQSSALPRGSQPPEPSKLSASPLHAPFLRRGSQKPAAGIATQSMPPNDDASLGASATTVPPQSPAAPIIRRPLDRNPDTYIAGDAPPGLPTRYAPRPSQTSRFTVSSGVMAANLISAPDPSYPTLARLAGIHGQVILQAVVARDGTISSTHVLRGHRLLRGAAQDAVRRWLYRPYLINGRPVDVATIITVDFHDPI